MCFLTSSAANGPVYCILYTIHIFLAGQVSYTITIPVVL